MNNRLRLSPLDDPRVRFRTRVAALSRAIFPPSPAAPVPRPLRPSSVPQPHPFPQESRPQGPPVMAHALNDLLGHEMRSRAYSAGVTGMPAIVVRNEPHPCPPQTTIQIPGLRRRAAARRGDQLLQPAVPNFRPPAEASSCIRRGLITVPPPGFHSGHQAGPVRRPVPCQ